VFVQLQSKKEQVFRHVDIRAHRGISVVIIDSLGKLETEMVRLKIKQ
jgi:hypothetical protein